VLHRVVREHLLTFLEQAQQHSDGGGLPRFVERELRRFVDCGVLARGFARLRCDDCHGEKLLPFSCKGRGFCPSCGGRRMVERSAHLVDAVLPHVPIRQWVLSLPHSLRYLFAFDHDMSKKALAIYARALMSFQRRRARRAGIANGRGGTITVIQRFASGLRLNLHLHTLMFDGVFHPDDAGGLSFHPLPPPTDQQVAQLVATVRKRILRLLRRRGLTGDDDDATPADDSHQLPHGPLAQLAGAAVVNTQAFGPRAGAPILRIGSDPRAPWVCSRKPRHAHLDGFDLHAAVAVAADDRDGLERLCRYLLRPAVADSRLELLDDGRVRVELKNEWSDGTSDLVFEPLDLLGRLASLVPRPRTNLLIYHGILAPNAKWRPLVVSYGQAMRQPPSETMTPQCAATHNRGTPPRYQPWADLMRRVFGLDVLECTRCGGRMRLLATIEAPQLVRAILDHLGMASEPPQLSPARAPPQLDATAWH
jgi:hypothetical protein